MNLLGEEYFLLATLRSDRDAASRALELPDARKQKFCL